MNCEHFQEYLYDYLDDTLSPPEKAAFEAHLRVCRVCREAVQSELLLARTLSTRLTQAVGSVNLDANAREGITKAALQTLGREEPKPLRSILPLLLGRRGSGRGGGQPSVMHVSWQRRLALPFAAAALILIGVFWLVFLIGHSLTSERTANRNPPGSLAASDRVASIQVSYSVPAYTFHKEGSLVVDALTCETLSMDGALRAKK